MDRPAVTFAVFLFTVDVGFQRASVIGYCNMSPDVGRNHRIGKFNINLSSSYISIPAQFTAAVINKHGVSGRFLHYARVRFPTPIINPGFNGEISGNVEAGVMTAIDIIVVSVKIEGIAGETVCCEIIDRKQH